MYGFLDSWGKHVIFVFHSVLIRVVLVWWLLFTIFSLRLLVGLFDVMYFSLFLFLLMTEE